MTLSIESELTNSHPLPYFSAMKVWHVIWTIDQVLHDLKKPPKSHIILCALDPNWTVKITYHEISPITLLAADMDS